MLIFSMICPLAGYACWKAMRVGNFFLFILQTLIYLNSMAAFVSIYLTLKSQTMHNDAEITNREKSQKNMLTYIVLDTVQYALTLTYYIPFFFLYSGKPSQAAPTEETSLFKSEETKEYV